MNRRGFLKGILAAATAPYVVTTAGVLMPVRKLWNPLDYDVEVVPTVFDLRARSMMELIAWYQREMNRVCGIQLEMMLTASTAAERAPSAPPAGA